jgi:hypothetical protein
VPGRSIRFTLLFRTTITIDAGSGIGRGVRTTRSRTSRHFIAGHCWRRPREIAGVSSTGTSRSLLRTGRADHLPEWVAAADHCGAARPDRRTKNPGCEAAGGQDDCCGGYSKSGASDIICPGRGTRASANTSGSDFTWRLWAPVKLRTLRSAPNEESLFLLPDRSEERAPRKRSSRLT